ncbi:MAG: hypothetical protein N4A33_01000 [Bacteriovoracaceae bacterium]|jgi:hypothetical protein|nr:hypothetical protein [Bacteriovoracaceae bacterium]
MKKLLIGLLAISCLSSYAVANDDVKDTLKKVRKTIAQAHNCQVVARDGYAVVMDSQCVYGIVGSAFEILESENRLPEQVIKNIKNAYYNGGSDTQQEQHSFGTIYQYSLLERTLDKDNRNVGTKYQLKAVDTVIKALENMY